MKIRVINDNLINENEKLKEEINLKNKNMIDLEKDKVSKIEEKENSIKTLNHEIMTNKKEFDNKCTIEHETYNKVNFYLI